MKILSATVVIQSGHSDKVSFITDLPSPFKCDEGTNTPLYLSFETMRNGGAEYVRTHFDIEPKIIEVS